MNTPHKLLQRIVGAFALCAGVGAVSAGDLSPAAAAVTQPSYVIRPVRALAPGDAFSEHVTSVTQTVQKRLSEGDNTTSSSSSVDATGTVTVTQVDKVGQLSAFVFTVTRLTQDAQSILQPGTQANITNDGGKTHFTVGGLPADARITPALAQVFFTRDPSNTVSDDAMFGSAVPRQVGESWDVNTRLIAQELGRSGFVFPDPSQLKGQAKFVGVERFKGEVVLHVHIYLNAMRVHPPGDPRSYFDLDYVFDELLPVDDNLVAAFTERYDSGWDSVDNIIIPEYHGGPMLATHTERHIEVTPTTVSKRP